VRYELARLVCWGKMSYHTLRLNDLLVNEGWEELATHEGSGLLLNSGMAAAGGGGKEEEAAAGRKVAQTKEGPASELVVLINGPSEG
jgi:hypothetical protein